MENYALILLSTVLVNNFVLNKFLGLCPFIGSSKQLDTAIGMGVATGFVLTLSAACAYLLETYVLLPWDLGYLRIICFILVIAGSVQLTELFIRKRSPLLHQLLGIYLPLITTNCAVLGVALLNIQRSHSFIESLLYGFGAALGFALVLILFTALREKQNSSEIPKAFQGTPISLITAGIMALAFMGFSGMVHN